MSKTSTEPLRHALNGPTMGTRWSALFFTEPGFDPAPLHAALQSAVDEVDAQMSTWNPGSDLMGLNAAPVGLWVTVPRRLAEVLHLGVAIGRASGGAFDIGMGDAVTAWGFGPEAADPARIRAAMAAPRVPAHDAIEFDGGAGPQACARRARPQRRRQGRRRRPAGRDAPCPRHRRRPLGDRRRDARARPAPGRTSLDRCGGGAGPRPPPPQSILALHNAAVATSGDYRHWVEVRGRRLSHTMDPARGAPLPEPPASVTVVAPTCAEADAWATALMVLGPERGAALATERGLDALFLLREDDGSTRSLKVGPLLPDRRSGWPRPEDVRRMDRTEADHLKTAILLLAVAGLVTGIALYAAGNRSLADIVWFAGVVPVLAALVIEILRSLWRGEVGLDIVAALSMSAALAFGETLAAAVVAVMYSGGTFLESYAEGRARREMHDLLARVPRTADALPQRRPGGGRPRRHRAGRPASDPTRRRGARRRDDRL